MWAHVGSIGKVLAVNGTHMDLNGRSIRPGPGRGRVCHLSALLSQGPAQAQCFGNLGGRSPPKFPEPRGLGGGAPPSERHPLGLGPTWALRAPIYIYIYYVYSNAYSNALSALQGPGRLHPRAVICLTARPAQILQVRHPWTLLDTSPFDLDQAMHQRG